jgi:hypothetical protein
LVAKDRDLYVFDVWRLAQTDQAEDPSEDHESPGAHHHGLIIAARHRAWSQPGR